MASWKPIEELDSTKDKWVIMYYMCEDMDGKNCDPIGDYGVPFGGTRFAGIHGIYDTEAEAIKVRNHFPNPNRYHVYKAHGRKLIDGNR